MTHDDDAPPPAADTPSDANVEKLLTRSWRPEEPSPEFARRVEERLLAEAAARPPRTRTRLWVGAAAAAAAAVLVAVSVSGRREPEPKEPAHVPTAAADARRATALRKHAWAETSPMFKGMKWLPAKFADPFVISQQYEVFTDPADAHKNADREAKAKWVAETDAVVFQKTYAHWLELFGERFELPRLETTDRVLHAVVTWNRDAFTDLFRASNPGVDVGAGAGIHGGIRAYYSPHQQRIFHYLGEDSMRSQDEIPCEGGRVQKFAYQVAAHEETHQLVHEYAAILQGRPLVDGAADVAPRRAMWFDEGLAEFMGAIELDAASKDAPGRAEFAYDRLPLARLAFVRGTGRGTDRRAQARLWTISELLRPDHHGELEQRAAQLDSGHRGEMVGLFYARSWGLVHFLWFYDGGKYRDRVHALMEAVLQGEQSEETSVRILGVGGPRAALEREFEWYWNECLKREIGTPGGPPLDTDTDPPAGRLDD